MLTLYNRKDKLPLETINLIKKILKENKIKIRESKITNINNSVFSVRVELKNIPGVGTNGKGITKEYALASAYAEFMERLQSGFLIKSDYLNKENHKCFFENEHPAKINEIEKYFLENKWKELALNDDKYCYVTSFYNVLNDTYENLPIKLINSLTHSNGLCAGNSEEEALVQGISEILERYCYKEIMIKEIEIPTIKIEDLEKYGVYQQLKELENLHFSYEIKDCSLGRKFPVVGIIIYNNLHNKYLFSIGSDPDFNIALQRCITEIFQGISINEIESKMKNLNADYEKSKERLGKDFIATNWLKCYSSNSGIHPRSIFKCNKEVSIEELPFFYVNDNKSALKILYRILDSEQLQIYIKNYSCLGFPTYKVYIPSLSEVDEPDEMKLQIMKYFSNLKNIYFNMYEATGKLTTEEENLLFELSNSEKYQTFMLPKNVFDTINNIECDYTKLNFFYILLIYLSISKKYSEILKYIGLKIEDSQISEFESEYLLCIKSILEKKGDMDEYSQSIINDVKALLFDTKKYLKKLKAPTCSECKKCPTKKQCQFNEWKKLKDLLIGIDNKDEQGTKSI